jgi:hypothetical protein
MTEQSATPDLPEIRRWVEAGNYDEFIVFIERYCPAVLCGT